MSSYLPNGEPRWSGDTAPRRRTLRRVADEWSDSVEDETIRLAFLWLALPVGAKHDALNRAGALTWRIAHGKPTDHDLAHVDPWCSKREIVTQACIDYLRSYGRRCSA